VEPPLELKDENISLLCVLQKTRKSRDTPAGQKNSVKEFRVRRARRARGHPKEDGAYEEENKEHIREREYRYGQS